jgi:S-adenosylmethionine synthetase
MYTAEQLDRHIRTLRDLEQDNYADTLAAYVDIVRRVAEQGDTNSDGRGDRVPPGIVEEARRLRGMQPRAGGAV